MIDNQQAALIAEGWHSVMTWNDPGVAMYSVTSTGKIHSEEHRTKLLAYIDDCMANASYNDSRGDAPCDGFESQVAELEALAEWVRAYKLADVTKP